MGDGNGVRVSVALLVAVGVATAVAVSVIGDAAIGSERADGSGLNLAPTEPIDRIFGLFAGGTVAALMLLIAIGMALARAAATDPLTGLVNRRRFGQLLRERLSGASRRHRPGALIVVDLDGLNDINEAVGEAVGDSLLRATARLLERLVSRSGVVARTGSDEFAVLLHGVERATAQAHGERIVEAIRQLQLAHAERRVGLTASVGVATFEGGESPDRVLSLATRALHSAKAAGRNRAIVAEARRTDGEAVPRIEWESRIRDALTNNGFVCSGQPIVRVTDGETMGVEILLRMRGSQGELVAPGAFLPVAERFGLIRDIDRWVVRAAAAYLTDTSGRLRAHVNLSPHAIGDAELLAIVNEMVRDGTFDPHRLVFEITETAAIADMTEARRFIEALKLLGCEIALDDFGVGFASFNYIKHLPVDYLKIDGSFVRNLVYSGVDQHLVRAMTDVAHTLGKQCVAEFVEDGATLDLVHRLGVDFAQGYYLGRPRPLTEAAKGLAFSGPRVC